MKKLGMFLMFVLSMAMVSHRAMAQEITIVLKPGCNWISYPNAEVMSIATALGDFTPAEGDVIKSQSKATKYVNGQWRGTLRRFTPGLGYHYYSARTTTVSFAFYTGVQQVTVTTATPTSVTTTSTVCGGTVTMGGQGHVFARGFCWSTHHNPTYDDNHTSDGTDIGSFSHTLEGLNPNTVYYVRAYVVSDGGLKYGNEKGFKTLEGAGGGHDYVDLGLPSGTLWATCNVGADTPEDYGDYFAWGETQPKSVYNFSTYQYCNGTYNTLTKYCNNPEFGYNGFTDNLTILQPIDDAATTNWGTDWRMPTREEWVELKNNTTSIWTTQNGVNGRLFTASNGNCLFLPAAGYSSFYNTGSTSYYWSSSLGFPYTAWCFTSLVGNYYMSYDDRAMGYTVRAVRSTSQNCTINVTANPTSGGLVSGGGTYQQGTNCTLTATANEGYIFTNWTENDEVVSTNASYTFTVNTDRILVANFTYNGGGDHEYVDLGLPSGTLWATCNVGANTPEEYGDYFAWGETEPKSVYDGHTYMYYYWYNIYYDHEYHEVYDITKYNTNSNYGPVDNLTILQPGDDVATVNWGANWRMPTAIELQELYQNTTQTWITLNGVVGRHFIGPNGNSLFLPAAGYRLGSGFGNVNIGFYWSNSLDTDEPSKALKFNFGREDCSVYSASRSLGMFVRPVRSAE